ncbi:MAG: hypothetical protein HOL29_08825 [Euryarchaeota archaeon]|jgi:hypothetical protein|nr:hypothetical protein [Euryarchaeota archaeon]
MKFEVIKGCVINGQGCKAGDVIDLDDAGTINSLMGISRIIPYCEAETVSDRSVGLSGDQPKKRSKKKY